MRPRWLKFLFLAPLGLLALAAFVALGGEIVKLLWNALLPELFGWPTITLWQALGLLALCRILFGPAGLRGPRRRRRRAKACPETAEERERIRHRLREKLGFAPEAGASAES